MKERIFSLLRFYAAFVVLQALQKPLFLFYAAEAPSRYGAGDVAQVVLHGLWLDAAVTGYLTAFPLLLLLLSLWARRFPLRAVLRPYIYLAVFASELAFVADAASILSGTTSSTPHSSTTPTRPPMPSPAFRPCSWPRGWRFGWSSRCFSAI